MAKIYALDANILISFHRSYYPFDIAPGFWRQLAEKSPGRVVLLDRIRNEIIKNDDELSAWLKQHDKCFINMSAKDVNIIAEYQRIITSVQSNKQYKESAKREFASVADSWICALALAYGYTVVTQEDYQPDAKKIVKIPNICREFNIPYINLLQFVREIGIRFD